MKFTAVGDAVIQRRIPEAYPGYEELAPFINQGDAKFFNLETTVSYEGECYGSAVSGGHYLRIDPIVIEDLKKFGFNMTTFNNNHTLDFSIDGMLKTLDHVNASGLVNAGVGRNLAEASAPRYLETANGRVALISISSTFEQSMPAGEQSKRVKGRPGVNPLRHTKIYTVDAEEFEVLKKVADKTCVNGLLDIETKEGFHIPPPEGFINFGGINFKRGEKEEEHSFCNKDDLARVKNSIDEARFQADYVIVTIHSHEVAGKSKEAPSEFLKEFAHFCIDCGADVMIGHGPHLLRGIEVYKDKPIFYSLGDFVFQIYDIPYMPEDIYTKYGMTSYNSNIYDFSKEMSKDFTIGLMELPVMLETVIPYWEMKDGKLVEMKLLPVEILRNSSHGEMGLPRIAKGTVIYERLKKLSQPFGVTLERQEDGIITCKW